MPDHHRPAGGFRNPWPGSQPGGLGAVLKWVLWERLTKRRPPDPAPIARRPVESSFATPRADPQTTSITWIGHASFLLQLAGLNILTDPMWSERASPVRFAGPRRRIAAGVAFEALPPIDVIAQSHDHYDHLDDASVRRLAARFPDAVWVMPLGLGGFARARGAQNVRELDWWGETRIGPLQITATPAQHFSGRSPFDRDRHLWCGWAMRAAGRAIWFAGDTGYHPEFGLIGSRLGPFDTALVPVGAYEPRWFMRPVHMNPEDAVQAFRDLRAGRSEAGQRTAFVPMHWGTFKLTDEPFDEPPIRTRAAWAAAGLPPDDLWVLAPGETRSVIPPD